MQIYTKEKMKRFKEVMPSLDQLDLRFIKLAFICIVASVVLIEISRMMSSIGPNAIYARTLFCLGEAFFFIALFTGHYILLCYFFQIYDLIPFLKRLGRDILNVLPVIPLYVFFVFLMFLILIYSEGETIFSLLWVLIQLGIIIFIWNRVYCWRQKKGYHHEALGVFILALLFWIITIGISYVIGKDIVHLGKDYIHGLKITNAFIVEVEDIDKQRDTYTFIFQEIDDEKNATYIEIYIRNSDLDEANNLILNSKTGEMTYYPYSGILVDYE